MIVMTEEEFHAIQREAWWKGFGVAALLTATGCFAFFLENYT